jgi:HD-GYP domain-containing protein (c-di-GMP phosphodiesterase class II)
MSKRRNLGTFVYRGLAVRLLLMTLVLAVVSSVVLVALYRSRVTDAVSEAARTRLRILANLAENRMRQNGDQDPHEALREALSDARGEDPLLVRLGRFVYFRILDDAGAPVLGAQDESYASLSAVLTYVDSHGTMVESPAKLELDVVRLGGRPHVYLASPLHWEASEGVLHLVAVFAVSDEARADMRRDLLNSMVWMVAIVCLAAAQLYPVILVLTRRWASVSQALLDSHLRLMQALGSAIAKRDSGTRAHNFRVTIMAVRVAELMDLPSMDIQRLMKGSYLHDVGKIGIRDNILLKPGKLTEAEFEIMKMHVGHGVDIVSNVDASGLVGSVVPATASSRSAQKEDWVGAAVDVIAGHHERFDGRGYPNGVCGEAIPLVARVFSVVDVFDALTCRRLYKEPFSFEKSLAIVMEDRGSRFDPAVVDAFASIAESLHRELAGREDADLRQELDAIVHHYFKAGLQSLYL